MVEELTIQHEFLDWVQAVHVAASRPSSRSRCRRATSTATGTLHRHGTMRLATARDEIEPLRDPRHRRRRRPVPDDPGASPGCITELGTLRQVTPHEVEGLFAADLAFLQDLYGIINFGDPADVEALQRAVLPEPSPSPLRRAADANRSSASRHRRRRRSDRPRRPRRARRATARQRDRIEEVASPAAER